MDTSFVPEDFDVPLALETKHFSLEPLDAKHNERDHAAWMSSIDHIRSTPGYAGRSWPVEMSVSENLVDIERHAEDFRLRKGFTYSVLDGNAIVGCVYLYPPKKADYDVQAQSWVIASRAALDSILWEEVSTWLANRWPFDRILYEPR